MSMRCAFMSSRPSSNTANRPIGPAPIMTTSVLIGSPMSLSVLLPTVDRMRWRLSSLLAMAGEEDRARRRRRDRPDSFQPLVGSRSLSLPLGRAHRQTVEIIAHLDLTRQPRVGLNAVCKVEHVLFHRRRLADPLPPSVFDVDVAGRAGAGAAALRFDPGHAVLDRRLHDGLADFGLDRASSALEVDKGDFDHDGMELTVVGRQRS